MAGRAISDLYATKFDIGTIGHLLRKALEGGLHHRRADVKQAWEKAKELAGESVDIGMVNPHALPTEDHMKTMLQLRRCAIELERRGAVSETSLNELLRLNENLTAPSAPSET